MRLLIIDNETEHLDLLQAIYAQHTVTTVTSDALADTDAETFDGLILAGNYKNDVTRQEDYFRKGVDIIRSYNKPIVGICIGFELICCAFGCQLHELAEQVVGATEVRPTESGSKLFQGTDPIRVGESNRWSVDELPRELIVLATSDTGIEAVKHRTKPIYGLQFYPDNFRYASDAKLVFENILADFTKY